MAKLITICCSLLLFVIAVALVNSKANSVSVSNFEVVLTAKEAKVSTDAVVLQIAVKNLSQEDLLILPWGTPLETQVSGSYYEVVEISEKAEKTLPYSGRMVKRRPPSKDDFILIKSEGTLLNSQNLSSSFEFSQSSKYKVRAHFSIDTFAYGIVGLLSSNWIVVET